MKGTDLLHTVKALGGVCLLGLVIAPTLLAQPTRDLVLSGIVRDAQSREPLIGANVYVPSLGVGAATGSIGTYRITLPPGVYEVRYSFVGYTTEVRTVDLLDRYLVVDVLLQPSIELEEVTVTAVPPAHEVPAMGVTRMDMRALERLPSFMGEVDVTRSLLLLPGVTSVGEGSGGFNVRGGNVDQNLILLDGTQVFFSSHLFGMFSAFNPELVESVTLYRGTMPPRFGGRISSIVDVRQRDGRSDRVGVKGTVGLVASRLTVEGAPLGTEDFTAIVGGRLSHANWLLHLVDRPELSNSVASYGDLGGRAFVRASTKLWGSVSGYQSSDEFRLASDTTYRYGTENIALQSTYIISPQVSVSTEAAHSRYRYGIASENRQHGFDFDAEVFHQRFQPATVWAPSWGTVEAGAAVNAYRVRPGRFVPFDRSAMRPITQGTERGREFAAFASADVERGRWRLDVGLRYGLWTTLGPATVPVIDPERPRGPASVVDTERVGEGEVVARYGGFEPRLGLRFSVMENASLKASYSRLRQNVHLLSNTTAPTPVDRWKLSDRHVRPQLGDQVTVGASGELGRGVTGSVEAYYRWLHDVPAYRSGAALLLSPHVAAELLDGDGRAYGVELFVEKPRGMITGWLSYTLSRAERRAFATLPVDQINNGQYYPADFDRPHDLSLTFAYHESAWATWGVNFVYSSGRPITVPTGAFDFGEVLVPSYSQRNQARVPAYHRLDLSLTVEAPAVPKGRYRGRWTFSIYNVYMRRNAYSVFFTHRPGTTTPQAYRLSTIGTMLPSISYTFEF